MSDAEEVHIHTEGQRPRISAREIEDPRPASYAGSMLPALRSIPVDMGNGGRIPPIGGQASGTKTRSIFEGGSRPPQGPEPRLASSRPKVLAQAVPASGTSEPELEKIIQHAIPAEGVTKQEASSILAVFGPAIDDAAKALAAGIPCVAIDDTAIAHARQVRDSFQKFITQAGPNDKADLPKESADLIERILECSVSFQGKQDAQGSMTTAFIVGGIVVGAIILYAVS